MVFATTVSNDGNGVDTASIISIAPHGKRNEGVVSLAVVNQVFLGTARNWNFNVATARIRPFVVVWIVIDDESNDSLKIVSGSFVVWM